MVLVLLLFVVMLFFVRETSSSMSSMDINCLSSRMFNNVVLLVMLVSLVLVKFGVVWEIMLYIMLMFFLRFKLCKCIDKICVFFCCVGGSINTRRVKRLGCNSVGLSVFGWFVVVKIKILLFLVNLFIFISNWLSVWLCFLFRFAFRRDSTASSSLMKIIVGLVFCVLVNSLWMCVVLWLMNSLINLDVVMGKNVMLDLFVIARASSVLFVFGGLIKRYFVGSLLWMFLYFLVFFMICINLKSLVFVFCMFVMLVNVILSVSFVRVVFFRFLSFVSFCLLMVFCMMIMSGMIGNYIVSMVNILWDVNFDIVVGIVLNFIFAVSSFFISFASLINCFVCSVFVCLIVVFGFKLYNNCVDFFLNCIVDIFLFFKFFKNELYIVVGIIGVVVFFALCFFIVIFVLIVVVIINFSFFRCVFVFIVIVCVGVVIINYISIVNACRVISSSSSVRVVI